MKKSANTQNLDRVLDALANKHRRKIVYILALQPSSITKLAQSCKLSLPAIHKHIKILEKANLVNRKKIGRTNFLVRNINSLQELQQWIAQYQTHWGNDKETLENYAKYLDEKQSKGGETTK